MGGEGEGVRRRDDVATAISNKGAGGITSDVIMKDLPCELQQMRRSGSLSMRSYNFLRRGKRGRRRVWK